ncbi:MAG TPA: hypothetical protein ENN24_00895 [Bacteroidetes bacterium]|nr:hypothetical protein [Bacteroidota bacterium]
MIQNKTILSIAYLPPISFIKQLLSAKEIFLEKHETYTKQTYRNRCEIYSANGKLSLSIPVVKPNGNRTKMCDVLIDNSVKWRREHWRAIASAYKNSAYFEFIRDYLEPFYENEWKFLWDFDLAIIDNLIQLLELNVAVKETCEFHKEYKHPYVDLRGISSQAKRDLHVEQNYTPYFQVFAHKHGFIPNLSIIDMLCNCGMDARIHLIQKGG